MIPRLLKILCHIPGGDDMETESQKSIVEVSLSENLWREKL